MTLTRQEVRRARQLQRRLKLLRFWYRIGNVVRKPWTVWDDKWNKWYFELKILRDKMILNVPPSQRIKPDTVYTKEEVAAAAKELNDLMKSLHEVALSHENRIV